MVGKILAEALDPGTDLEPLLAGLSDQSDQALTALASPFGNGDLSMAGFGGADGLALLPQLAHPDAVTAVWHCTCKGRGRATSPSARNVRLIAD